MFCTKCGSYARDKYCGNCGMRVRTGLAEFRLEQRRARTAFRKEVDRKYQIKGHCLAVPGLGQLEDAAWWMAEEVYADPVATALQHDLPLPYSPERALEKTLDLAWKIVDRAVVETHKIWLQAIKESRPRCKAEAYVWASDIKED